MGDSKVRAEPSFIVYEENGLRENPMNPEDLIEKDQTPKKYGRLKKTRDLISECGICFGEIRAWDSELSFVKLESCSHMFCEGCFLDWAQNSKTCPNCRTPCKYYTKSNGQYIQLVMINTACECCDQIQPVQNLISCEICQKYFCHKECFGHRSLRDREQNKCSPCLDFLRYQ